MKSYKRSWFSKRGGFTQKAPIVIARDNYLVIVIRPAGCSGVQHPIISNSCYSKENVSVPSDMTLYRMNWLHNDVFLFFSFLFISKKQVNIFVTVSQELRRGNVEK